MSDLFSNPWFYIIIAVSIIVGNISLLKYTAHMKFPNQKKNENKKSDEKDNHDSEK